MEAQMPKRKTRSEPARLPETTAAELDLHAHTVEEAVLKLEGFLYESYRRRLDRVRVIHGKGTGTLKLEVRRYLSRHSLVASYTDADYWHGGAGATDVELSRR
jgi:DNA mismatch repair protein MutS2